MDDDEDEVALRDGDIDYMLMYDDEIRQELNNDAITDADLKDISTSVINLTKRIRLCKDHKFQSPQLNDL